MFTVNLLHFYLVLDNPIEEGTSRNILVCDCVILPPVTESFVEHFQPNVLLLKIENTSGGINIYGGINTFFRDRTYSVHIQFCMEYFFL